MPVEDMQRHAGHQRVAQGVLLVEEGGVSARLGRVPGAPLVDDQADVPARIVVIHDGDVLFDAVLNRQGLLQDDEPLFFAEVGRGEVHLPHKDVVVQGQGVDSARAEGLEDVAHQHFRAIDVRPSHAAGDLHDPVAAVVTDVHLELAVEIGVVFGPHTAAAAPVLVADAPERDLPRLGPAVGPAQAGQRAVAVEGQVFHPLGHLARGAAAHVAADVWLAAELVAEIHELMGPEVVVLGHTPPVHVHDGRTLLAGPDPVRPVVVVRKAPARPAQHGDPDVLEGLHHVRADAPDMGDGRVEAHPDTFVDAPAQVLGKVTVDLGGDGLPSLVNPDHQGRGHGRGRGAGLGPGRRTDDPHRQDPREKDRPHRSLPGLSKDPARARTQDKNATPCGRPGRRPL